MLVWRECWFRVYYITARITAQLTRILNLPFQLQNDLFLGEVARRRSGGDYDITRRVRWKGNDRCVSTGPQGLPLSDCC